VIDQRTYDRKARDITRWVEEEHSHLQAVTTRPTPAKEEEFDRESDIHSIASDTVKLAMEQQRLLQHGSVEQSEQSVESRAKGRKLAAG